MTKEDTDIKTRFFNSLKCGTGEAYLILQNNPGINFSKLIIKGAVKNYAYDRQCEGSRAKYIYKLIRKSKQQEKIINNVLAELEFKKKDYWSLDQMCDLAVLFFKAGHIQAKTSLINRFEKSYHNDYEFCGQDQLMEIDGINGVLKVAECIGKEILEENDREDSWHIDNFQKNNKELQVYNELKKAGETNKFIKAYYNSVLENKRTLSKHRKFAKFSYELVKEKIDANKFRYISVDRANDLSDKEVEKLAHELLAEKNKQKQELYVRFFTKRKFPFDHTPLLKIASGKNPANTRLVEFSVNALKYFSGADIRELALEKITKLKNPCDYLDLLVCNYQINDYVLLNQIANRSENYEFIHSIVFGFLEIYEANPTTECKEPLEIIYSKMNCGLHREDVVRILYNNNVLSDKILQEIKFDSNPELQKRYKFLTKIKGDNNS